MYGPSLFQRWGKRIKNFRKAWNVACALAGVADFLFRDLRRSAVKNMEDAESPGTKRSIYRRYHIVSD